MKSQTYPLLLALGYANDLCKEAIELYPESFEEQKQYCAQMQSQIVDIELAASPSRKPQEASPKKVLAPGVKAKCLYNNGLHYGCTVVGKDENGKWTVEWDDGDSVDESNHPSEHFTQIEETQTELKIGTNAKCLHEDGKYHRCTIESISSENETTYSIIWDDISIKSNVSDHPRSHFKDIEVDSSLLQPGAKGLCLYRNGRYYPCTLVNKNKHDGNWTVNWDDGDIHYRINHPPSHFKDINVDTHDINLEVGMRVMCLHPTDGIYSWCKLVQQDPRTTHWAIEWENGDTEFTQDHPSHHFQEGMEKDGSGRFSGFNINFNLTKLNLFGKNNPVPDAVNFISNEVMSPPGKRAPKFSYANNYTAPSPISEESESESSDCETSVKIRVKNDDPNKSSESPKVRALNTEISVQIIPGQPTNEGTSRSCHDRISEFCTRSEQKFEEMKTQISICLSCILCIGVILMCVLCPLSFDAMEEENIGFLKHDINKKVRFGRLYEPGHWNTGPMRNFITCRGKAHAIFESQTDTYTCPENLDGSCMTQVRNESANIQNIGAIIYITFTVIFRVIHKASAVQKAYQYYAFNDTKVAETVTAMALEHFRQTPQYYTVQEIIENTDPENQLISNKGLLNQKLNEIGFELVDVLIHKYDFRGKIVDKYFTIELRRYEDDIIITNEMAREIERDTEMEVKQIENEALMEGIQIMGEAIGYQNRLQTDALQYEYNTYLNATKSLAEMFKRKFPNLDKEKIETLVLQTKYLEKIKKMAERHNSHSSLLNFKEGT